MALSGALLRPWHHHPANRPLGSVSPRHLFVQFDKSVDLLAERDVILDRNLAGLLGALPSGALMHGLEF